MSPLSALQNSLSSAITDQSLVLNQSLLDAALLKPFPQGSMGLEQVSLTLKNKALLLTGQIKQGWQLPGNSALVIHNLTLSAKFTETANVLNTKFSFVGDILIGGKIINLTGSINKQKI